MTENVFSHYDKGQNEGHVRVKIAVKRFYLYKTCILFNPVTHPEIIPLPVR